MAIITAAEEVTKLRRSGQIAAQALQAVAAAVRSGITTKELDDIAAKTIRQAGAEPSFLGFNKYPASLCTSINAEVVHGLPSDKRMLVEGDIIGLDIGVNYLGLFSDHAVTVPVGKIDGSAKKLLDATKKSLGLAIAAAQPGRHIGDIGAAVQNFLEPQGFGIVTQLTGHGVGKAVHEPPTIFNVGPAGRGPVMTVGMVLAIEPMVTAGRPAVDVAEDGWTVITHDGSLAAHFEHTVLVTAAGAEIITHAPLESPVAK